MGLWVHAAIVSNARAQDARGADTMPVATLVVRVQLPDGAGAHVARDRLVELRGARAGLSRTDASGRARFPQRPLGSYTVHLTVAGYAPIVEQVELSVRGVFELPVLLSALAAAQPLPMVTSTARRSPVPGLDARRSTARGHLFDRASIDSLEPRRVSDLLRRVPSVRLVASGSGFVPRTRRAAGMNDCPMSVYLDGVQVDDERGLPPAPAIGQPARTARVAPPSVIDGLSVDLLEAVEVYVGASEVPSQFNQAGGSCGVIALWTRARR